MARSWAGKFFNRGWVLFKQGGGVNTVCPLCPGNYRSFNKAKKSWTFPYFEYMHRSFLATWLATYYTLYYSLDKQLAIHILTQSLDDTGITVCYIWTPTTKQHALNLLNLVQILWQIDFLLGVISILSNSCQKSKIRSKYLSLICLHQLK